MTADTFETAGAAPHGPGDWHSIDWKKVNENVRRLQARIVKATKEGKWARVKALQHLLTHSFSGKALAVRRVTENQGRHTPGVDKVTWKNPDSKWTAVHDLKRRGYKPLPLRRVYIPKSNGKKRPLGIPTMKDRAMQALYLLALDPVAETTADPNSYGFRLERRCADAIEQCFNSLSRASKSASWVLDADIKSCFDRISHDWLTSNIPMDRRVLQKWLKAGYMDKSVIYETEEGTPQGGIISPVLANLALDGLERRLREKYPTSGKGKGRGEKAKVNLVRYADDFIITGASKETLEDEVTPLVVAFLKERGLELSPEKTRIVPISDGFDFLSQNIRRYNDGKMIIKPSKDSIKRFLAGIRSVVKKNKQATTEDLVNLLNPKIKGWAFYHRHVCSKETFYYIDHAITNCIWQWAKRRHQAKHKSLSWIKKHYFGHRGGKDWILFAKTKDKDGNTKTLWLMDSAHIPIQRHTKIRGEANPYDPEDEPYFEERIGKKMAATLHGRRKLHYLWVEQEGLCPICHEKITKTTGWHNHHIVWRCRGGSDNLENRVLLHPNCHMKVHAKNIAVLKPRPEKGVRQA